MKLLFIHSDFVEFEAKKPALKNPPSLTESEKAGRAEEAVVAFFSVEKPDEEHADEVVKRAVTEVQNVTKQLGTERVVVYPYAHLSSDLASPSKAQQIGEKFKQAVIAAGFETSSAPFGWYKAFTLKAKGHPLSELSRSIRVTAEEAAAAEAGVAVEAHESEALKKEKKLVSHWYILTPEGELTEAKDFDFQKHPELKAFYKHETEGTRAAGKEIPAHVKIMQDQELVDYEPGSDPGNFRWYPKGQLIKRLLETHVSDLVAEEGGMRVETPIMYDYEHPALKKYLDRFPARQYILKSEDKEYFLRFAACFGQYLIMHDMTLSYRDLPVRLYELTHYSFRREQRGELSGLRRLRTFTMPDMHTLVADMDAGKEEFLKQFQASMKWMADMELPYNAGVRFVRSFFDENRDFAVGLAKQLGKPILLEIWDDRFFYFVMKFEFNTLDTQGKASALSTVQIDVENSERFGIDYVNAEGQKVTPYLLHASLSGSIDRNVYAMLENEARKAQRGEKASFPFWLAPTQVRIIPVSDQYREPALAMAAQIRADSGARVDVDDRDLGVGRKIRETEKEWVPLSIVYGEKEAADPENMPVRVRGGEDVKLSVDGIAKLARERRGNRPTASLPTPVQLSKRPIFNK